jgi:hypothetical protein
LSTSSCRNSSTVASSAATTRARLCATILACPRRCRRRGCAKPPGPNNDDLNLYRSRSLPVMPRASGGRDAVPWGGSILAHIWRAGAKLRPLRK